LRNPIRHGLFAKCVVSSNESLAGFRQRGAPFADRFGRFKGVEKALVEVMTASSWRLRRIGALETRALDDALAAQSPGGEMGRTAVAFRSLAGRPELNIIHRCEARFHTMYQRALYNLLLMRTLRNTKRTGSPLPRTPGVQNEPTNRLKTKKHRYTKGVLLG
jgi:hypothetical protein